MMRFLELTWHLIRNLGEDPAWRDLLSHVGMTNVYLVLFAIIFAETGLVILPFLPGDSLLFAIGAMSARNIGFSLPVVCGLLIVAAVLGDAVNYAIGKWIGPSIFSRPEAEVAGKPSKLNRLLNRKHLEAAQAFYDKHGGKTIILARFVPIVRTFAPFVAGIGKMSYPKFFAYNVVGAIAWVLLCVGAGRLFGGIEFVKKHFEAVILMIVFISVLPVVYEVLKARRQAKHGFDPVVNATQLGESQDAPPGGGVH